MENVLVQLSLAAVAIIAFVLTGVIGIFNTVDKHRETAKEATSLEPGSKGKLNSTGKRLFTIQTVALVCGLVALIGSIYGSARSSQRVTELLSKGDDQAKENGRQTTLIEQQSSLIDSLKSQTATLTANAQAANLVLSQATQDLQKTQTLLVTTNDTTARTHVEISKLRTENDSLKDEYATLRDAVKQSGKTSIDVKNTLAAQDKARAKREDMERHAAELEAQDRNRRASQTYVASFHVPKGMGVSFSVEGRQQENVFIYIKVPDGIIKLQCELAHGVHWVAGTTGKDFAIAFKDNSSRQAIHSTRVTAIGGVVKFNGEPMQFIEIPFPQENEPNIKITY